MLGEAVGADSGDKSISFGSEEDDEVCAGLGWNGGKGVFPHAPGREPFGFSPPSLTEAHHDICGPYSAFQGRLLSVVTDRKGLQGGGYVCKGSEQLN